MKNLLFVFSFFTCQFCANAQNWQDLDNWPNRFIRSLYVDTVSDKLYLGGDFSQINGEDIRGIGTWNGVQWDSLGAGMDEFNSSFPNNTYAISRYNGDIIAGGGFNQAGDVYTKYLAKWNGSQWDSIVGGQPNSAVRDIRVYNNELYICGSFDSVGNTPANCLAKWNGTVWQSIGNNFSFSFNAGQLFKMVYYQGNLYVVGSFLDAQGNVCRMAKWDGINWIFFTNEFPSWTSLRDMEVYNNKLYVAGMFSMPNGKECIVTWNDTVWSGVGGGVQLGPNNPYPTIKDLCVHNGKLYCVGSFESIGGIPASGPVSWDGVQWCSDGSSFNAGAQFVGGNNIEFYHDTMYVSGGFTYVDTTQIWYIAKWVGGNYIDTCGFISTGINDPTLNNFSVKVFPNPVISNATFQFPDSDERKTLIIYNQLGKEIWRKETDENQIDLSVERFASGLYFYRVEQLDGKSAAGKFIVE